MYTYCFLLGYISCTLSYSPPSLSRSLSPSLSPTPSPLLPLSLSPSHLLHPIVCRITCDRSTNIHSKQACLEMCTYFWIFIFACLLCCVLEWGQLMSPPTINTMDENHLWSMLSQMVPGFTVRLTSYT